MREARALAYAAVCAPLLAGGCAGGLSPSGSSLTTATLPSVKMPDIGLPKGEDPTLGTPTELYTRIARGSLSCWFGKDGPLKKAYVFHAEAASAARGGKAEILVHEKDPTNPSPFGLKAFRIGIEPVPNSETASLKIESLKMAEPMAARMTADIHRWASGDVGCGEGGAWAAFDPDAPQPAPPKPKKKKAVAAATAGKK